jgi:chromosome partitioning protein
VIYCGVIIGRYWVWDGEQTGGGDDVIVVTMLNQKGGVGKTSCAHHLAGEFAARGRRVLLVDNDPQSSLTQGFWGPNQSRRIDPSESIAALYRGDRPFPELVVRPSGVAGLSLLPGSRAATTFNVPDPEAADPERQSCIRSFLEDLGPDSYDLAMIDCPPNLHLCSWAALVASDFLIVPTQPEDYGAQGLHDVQESVAMVRGGANPSLELLGYLLTRVARKAVHQLYEQTLRDRYGELVFAARMPDAVGYIEAIAARLPAAQHRPKGAPAGAIREIASEIESRIEACRPIQTTRRAEVA